MGHWVKLNYERQEYIIDLDRISAFALAANGRVTLWLPDSSIPLIFSDQAEPNEYYKILNYIDKITAHPSNEMWMWMECDRQEYIINLHRISSFCHAGHKIMFWLPDSGIDITLTQQSNPEAYQTLQDFIHRTTGESFSE
ncbi:MAG: hypothetical protein SAJ12_15790 [Jaaginema sp. PMC 1079.18]|nr:hypothetical protein [Jaaginema sp. PMC 1080.18]MEC4852446.1 hypothetical protein [Jaaginema sp. PMC 1079.18]MEC4864531.1 hypothetical protein [Jaaginema sp. PMC 1078.18]